LAQLKSTTISGSLSVSTSITGSGIIKGNNEIISTYANGFRLAYGSYGVILRNDNSNFYFLLTNSGSALSGTWNSLRPFYFSLSTGKCTVNTTSDKRLKTNIQDLNEKNTVYILKNTPIK